MNKGNAVAPTIDLVKLGLGVDTRNYYLVLGLFEANDLELSCLVFILMIFQPLPMKCNCFIIATLMCAICTNMGENVHVNFL